MQLCDWSIGGSVQCDYLEGGCLGSYNGCWTESVWSNTIKDVSTHGTAYLLNGRLLLDFHIATLAFSVRWLPVICVALKPILSKTIARQ